jgi:hypothetical protein
MSAAAIVACPSCGCGSSNPCACPAGSPWIAGVAGNRFGARYTFGTMGVGGGPTRPRVSQLVVRSWNNAGPNTLGGFPENWWTTHPQAGSRDEYDDMPPLKPTAVGITPSGYFESDAQAAQYLCPWAQEIADHAGDQWTITGQLQVPAITASFAGPLNQAKCLWHGEGFEIADDAGLNAGGISIAPVLPTPWLLQDAKSRCYGSIQMIGVTEGGVDKILAVAGIDWRGFCVVSLTYFEENASPEPGYLTALYSIGWRATIFAGSRKFLPSELCGMSSIAIQNQAVQGYNPPIATLPIAYNTSGSTTRTIQCPIPYGFVDNVPVGDTFATSWVVGGPGTMTIELIPAPPGCEPGCASLPATLTVVPCANLPPIVMSRFSSTNCEYRGTYAGNSYNARVYYNANTFQIEHFGSTGPFYELTYYSQRGSVKAILLCGEGQVVGTYRVESLSGNSPCPLTTLVVNASPPPPWTPPPCACADDPITLYAIVCDAMPPVPMTRTGADPCSYSGSHPQGYSAYMQDGAGNARVLTYFAPSGSYLQATRNCADGVQGSYTITGISGTLPCAATPTMASVGTSNPPWTPPA